MGNRYFSVKIILPLILALLVFVIMSDKLITGSVIFSENCIDSDDTIYPIVKNINDDSSYFIQGFTGYLLNNGIKSEKIDYCSKNKVVEYYCKYGRVRTVYKKCGNGCLNGACVGAGNEEGGVQACADSDGGKDYRTKGNTYSCSCSYENGALCSCIEPVTDYCINSITLNEAYCEDRFVSWENHNCEHGCEDGICLREPAKKTIYQLSCSSVCKGEDSNGVGISYNQLYKSAEIGNFIRVSTTGCTYASCFAEVEFDSALSGSHGAEKIIFAHYTNQNYYESLSPSVYLSHMAVSNDQGYIKVIEGEPARTLDWVIVNPEDKGRILEISYIAIQDNDLGRVKITDVITREAKTVKLENSDGVYSTQASLFDNTVLNFTTGRTGGYINISWTESGNTELPKIKLKEGGWIVIGTLSQLARVYNFDLANLGDGEKTWPAVLFIEDNANRDMILVPLAMSGNTVPVKMIVGKPYATTPITS